MTRTLKHLLTHSLISLILLASAPSHAELELFFVHNDHLNTPKVLTDTTGKAVWQAQSTPFGEVVENTDPDQDGRHVTLNMRFPGQYWDHETGTSYNYFRDYNPALGRYIQSDPIGLKGGINTYGYVLGNPIINSDPLGLAPKRFGKNHPHCLAIKNRINGLRNELDTRWSELVGGLPERIGPGERLADTMRGHRTLINMADSNLQKWESRYDEECNDNDSDEGSGGNMCEACPSGTTVVKTAVGAGALYLGYRCVRMLPSLYPPLWWTIPSNLAAP